jgi:DNA-binding transcriptional MerR regulator/effector-binding domain-containing protein
MESEKLFSIGEFSKITGLTVKALRFYHEEGLLEPSCIDDQTGYRYYDAAKIEPARVIALLRELEFPLPEITEILHNCRQESELLAYLQRHQTALAAKVEHYRHIDARLEQLIHQQQEARNAMKNGAFEVEEKTVPAMLMAGLRMQGQYRDCGQGFSKIARQFGRYLGGPCFLLHYDDEYKDVDANFEACFPLRSAAKNIDAKKSDGISTRELSGGRCVALLHQGPYEELSRSYEKILLYIKSKGYNIEMATREVYLKGPGMIFKGNPKKYLTEIQMLIQS